jgi:hypothetical protein
MVENDIEKLEKFFFSRNNHDKKYLLSKLLLNAIWGLGDWGLGIGDWAQSPIPNPQSPIPIVLFEIEIKLFILSLINILKKYVYFLL